MSIESTVAQLKEWSDAYYNGEPMVSDSHYDKVYDSLLKKAPQHPFFQETGAPIKGTKQGHTYFTGSLNKVKPDTPELKRFLKKKDACETNVLVLSEKLDGVSIVFERVTAKGAVSWKAMSRGDGIQGQDVSHNLLQSGFEIPDPDSPAVKALVESLEGKPLVVRGELIIPRSYPSDKPLRSVVNGAVNTKTPNLELLPSVHFVAYGLPGSELAPLQQIKQLQEMGFRTPIFVEFKLTKKKQAQQVLKQLLVSWKTESIYDIDGVVMSYNIYEAPSAHSEGKNPEWSKAFKMLLDEQTKETYIDSIDWRISGSGFLHPTAILQPPVVIGSAKIGRVTCFHAEFVETNRIGAGAKVLISRSGDVIPKIEEIVEPAETPDLPNHLNFQWDDTHKNIYLVDEGDHSEEVSQAAFLEFTTRLDITGLKKGMVSRFCESGITSPEILAELSLEELKEKTGLKKQAETIYQSFHQTMDSMTLPQFIHARGIMGRGFGKKIVQGFLDELGYQRFVANDLADSKAEKSTRDVSGGIVKWNSYLKANMTEKTPVLKSYLEKIIERTTTTSQIKEDTDKASEAGEAGESVSAPLPLSGQQYLFTGGKNKALIQKIESLGGTIVARIPSKNYEQITLLTATLDSTSSKMKTAQQKNIPIMLTSELEMELGSL